MNSSITSCDLSRVVFTVSGTDGAEITYDIESSDGFSVVSSIIKVTLGLNGIGLFDIEIDPTERIKLKDVSVKDSDGNVVCSDDFTVLPDGGKLAIINGSVASSFTYAVSYCRLTDTNPVATSLVGGPGEFTAVAVAAGTLVFADDTTGEIDLVNSDAGEYDITFTSDDVAAASTVRVINRVGNRLYL